MQLMVVEDDLVTGTLLKKVLSKAGYDVTHKTNGSDALASMQTAPHRIILTDWIMPEMDGPTLCRHIRELDLPHYVYIILLTAKDSKKDAVIGLEAGADDYIIKPFDNHELMARIRAGRRLVELEDANKDAHKKLARSEKLAAVGHLAAGVAHEINNPIGFINSNLNSLKDYVNDMRSMIGCYRELTQKIEHSINEKQLHPELPKLVKRSLVLEDEYDIDFLVEDAQELVKDCSDGTLRIKAIVHEMRYFAHPEKQAIEPHPLDKLLEKVIKHFEPQLPRGVTLDNETDQLPPIPCNAPHIEQALTNLIQNAMDAVQEEGRISIHNQCQDHFVTIRITDNGRGISESRLSKVFDPFYTTKPVGQGVGLGLTTALNIIKMHNGSITAESRENGPTSFIVQLPAAES